MSSSLSPSFEQEIAIEGVSHQRLTHCNVDGGRKRKRPVLYRVETDRGAWPLSSEPTGLWAHFKNAQVDSAASGIDFSTRLRVFYRHV